MMDTKQSSLWLDSLAYQILALRIVEAAIITVNDVTVERKAEAEVDTKVLWKALQHLMVILSSSELDWMYPHFHRVAVAQKLYTIRVVD